MKKQRILAMAMAASMLISSIGITAFAQNKTDTMPIKEQLYEEKVRATMSPEAAAMQNEVRQEQEMHENYYEKAVMLGETAELSADTVTIAGTVTLGSGVTAKEDGRIGVYLYEFEKDGNRIVEIANSSTATGYANISKGESKASYSFTAPKGNYAIGTRYYMGSSDVVGNIVYYKADGAVYDKELADVVNLTSDKIINVTIPKAERTISGTVTLENPPAEDTYFYIDLYSNDAEVSSTYQSIPVSAGAKNVDYSIGVSKGSYELYAYLSGGSSKYYSVYGDLREWEDICYINTTEKSVTGLDFVYSGEEESDSNYKSLDVNVKLASKAEENKKYGFFYEIAGGSNKSTYSVDLVSAGEYGFTRRVSLPQNKEIYVGVFDRTYVSTYSDDGIAYYYSEQFGVTTDKSAATPINVSELDSLDITFPKSYELSGTVSRNGLAKGEQLDLYVIAQWDSERFYTNVRMSASEDSKEYTINIPTWAEGVEVSVYSKLRTVDMGLEVEASSVPVSVIASANMAKTNISAPPSTTMSKVSGTVNFGAALPEGGSAVTIGYNNMGEEYSYFIDAVTLIAKAGATSLDYSVYVPVCESTLEDEKVRIRVAAEAAGTAFDGSVTKRLDPSALGDYDVTMPYLDQVVSGKIILPDGLELSSGMTVEVCVEYDYNGTVYTKYTYASIIKGEKSATYSVRVPSGATLTRIWLYAMTTGTLAVNADDVHYSPDGSTTDYTELSIPLTNGYSNADIKLPKANMIMGSIIVPEDFEGEVDCQIYSDGGYSFVYIDSPGVYPYSVSVPEDMTSTTLQFNFREESPCNYYTGRMYYTSNGMVYNSWEAEEISMANGVVSGIDVEMVKGTYVTGKLSFEEGAFLDGEINVYIGISNNYINAEKSYRVTSVDGIEYSVPVPAAEDSNVTLSVEVYNYDGAKTNIPSGQYYYEGVPLVGTDRWSAVEIDVAQGYEADLIIPIGQKVSGKFILPENAKGRVDVANLFFEDKTGGMSVVAYPDETGYYEVYVLASGYYTISMRPNQLVEPSNIKIQDYYYVNANESTTDYNNPNVAVVDLSNGAENINFYLETGKTVSGTVMLPEGTTGNGGMYIVVEDAKSTQSSSHYVFVENSGTEFMITPTYMTDSDVIISYYIYGIDGVYDKTLYYTSSGPTLDASKAEPVSVGENGIENLELKAIRSKGSIELVPKRLNCTDMDYIYANTILEFDNGSEQNTTLYVYDYEYVGYEEELAIPDTTEFADVKTFKVCVEVEGVRWYLTESGIYTKNAADAKTFEVKDMSIDVPIPDATINYPDMLGENLYIETTLAKAYTDNDIILIQTRVGANGMNYDYIMPGAYIGVYDGDRLVEVLSGEYYVTSTSSPYQVTFSQQYDLEMCISANVNENYTYKLFTWNNLAMAAPLADTVEVTVQ